MENIPITDCYLDEFTGEIKTVLIVPEKPEGTIIEEPFDQNSSNNLNDISENLNDISTSIEEKKLRNKRKNVDSKKWDVNKNKRKREKGENYFGRKKCKGEWNYDIPKEKRQIKGHCNCKISSKKAAMKCKLFSDKERDEIFKNFWSELTWDQRKIHINHLVKKQITKRHRNRKEEDTSRRKFSWIYTLKKQNEDELRVCKTMFLNTLGIKERTVIDWKNHTFETQHYEKENISKNKKNLVNESDEAIIKSRKDVLKEFLRDLPKVESHYCRAKSSKLYLEPNWQSKFTLFKFYETWSNEQNVKPVSIALFTHVFEEMNLSLFKPKKDECDQCVSYRAKNMTEEQFTFHQFMKNEAREAKQKDKTSNNRIFCMDMQAVMLSPKSNTSALYFKMKLIVHNFTVYDMQSHRGYCFIWHEAAGGVCANNYSSIICFFLHEYVLTTLEDGQNIILYSDGCTSQNRNVTLSNALLNFAKSYNVIIEQKYLEKGHTQMEADSMHSLIEKKLKKTNINVPADYVRVCLEARTNPEPFIVKYLDFNFFKDFSSIKILTTIRPGRKVGDPVVTDLRALKYTPDGKLFYKIRHSNDYSAMDQRNLLKNKVTSCLYTALPQLYKQPLAIKKDKWDHLQSLKNSMPQDFHIFYDTLLYQ